MLPGKKSKSVDVYAVAPERAEKASEHTADEIRPIARKFILLIPEVVLQPDIASMHCTFTRLEIMVIKVKIDSSPVIGGGLKT